MKRDSDDNNDDGWEYGDVWKQGTPETPAADDDVEYVEVLRGDTGTGFDDSFMIDLIGYLSSAAFGRPTMRSRLQPSSAERSRCMFSR
jgi:hypothetical protein